MGLTGVCNMPLFYNNNDNNNKCLQHTFDFIITIIIMNEEAWGWN